MFLRILLLFYYCFFFPGSHGISLLDGRYETSTDNEDDVQIFLNLALDIADMNESMDIGTIQDIYENVRKEGIRGGKGMTLMDTTWLTD